MECEKVKTLLPGYLDGGLHLDDGSESHLMIGQHLEACGECREELQGYLTLSSLMSRVERAAPPADLALRIRVAAAQRLSDNPWVHYARRARTRGELILENILEPLALPATGGLTVALVVFILVPDNPTIRRQLDLVLMFSRFRPQMSFGRFTSGGRVVLSFSDISVKG